MASHGPDNIDDETQGSSILEIDATTLSSLNIHSSTQLSNDSVISTDIADVLRVHDTDDESIFSLHGIVDLTSTTDYAQIDDSIEMQTPNESIEVATPQVTIGKIKSAVDKSVNTDSSAAHWADFKWFASKHKNKWKFPISTHS